MAEWKGWSVTVYTRDGEVESRERHQYIRDVAGVVAANAGKRIVHIHPGLSPDRKRELDRLAFVID